MQFGTLESIDSRLWLQLKLLHRRHRNFKTAHNDHTYGVPTSYRLFHWHHGLPEGPGPRRSGK